MGVDLGLKVPAVVVTETGETKFCGKLSKDVKKSHRIT